MHLNSPNSDSRTFRQNSRILWWVVLVVMIAAYVGMAAVGLSVDFKSNPALLILTAVYAATTWFYRSIRFDQRLSQALITVAQLLLTMILGLLCSYAVAATAMPYQDATLLAIDQWLGFDRQSYVRVFTGAPWKIHLSDFIYQAMLPQLAFVPFVLVVTNRTERLQRFVAAYGVALISTIAIFMFVPAVGAFVYFDLTPAQYAALPIDVYTPARTLDALRSGIMKIVRLNNLEGIIAFPSFHTAASILYSWALWPVKSIRRPVAALNAAIISTTPVCGAHYAIDVIAGAAVAIGAIVASGLLRRSTVGLHPTPQFQSI